MRNKIFAGLVVATLIAVLFVGFLGPVSSTAYAYAPAFAPTPQSFNPSVRDSQTFTFFSQESITADTRECLDMHSYDGADISYVIDETTVNTITLKVQFSNDNSHYYDSAQTLASAVVADDDGFQRFLTYGRSVCIYADVANSNAVVITAIAQGK